MGQFNANAVTHGGGGGWGFSGGTKTSLIPADATSSKVRYQFDELLSALREIEAKPLPAHVDLTDVSTPVSRAVTHFCSDFERAGCDLGNLLNQNHVPLSSVAVVLVHAATQNKEFQNLDGKCPSLKSAILNQLVRLLCRYDLSSKLSHFSDDRPAVLTQIMGKLRMRVIRILGASKATCDQFESIAWVLQAVALLSTSEESRPVLMASLHEMKSLAHVVRELPHKSGSESAHQLAEFRACEALASGLEALNEKDRDDFCRGHLFENSGAPS